MFRIYLILNVKQSDGIDVWYSNIGNIGVQLYDYVSKGTLVGECNDSLYLVFKKDGNVLDYKEYIQGEDIHPHPR